MSKYLEQFPTEYHTFIKNRFSQAYVFSEQSFEFGEDDVIDLAVGPRTMKTRVVESCQEMAPLVDDERREILEQIINTIDSADEFLVEVKAEVDRVWQEAKDYAAAHPPTKRAPSPPATEKQLKFLKTLGCLEIPKTKTEASRLIERYKNR